MRTLPRKARLFCLRREALEVQGAGDWDLSNVFARCSAASTDHDEGGETEFAFIASADETRCMAFWG